MMKKSLSLLTFRLFGLILMAQDQKTAVVFSNEQLHTDVRYLGHLFADTHPDPYSAFGGQESFRRYFQDWIHPAQKLDISGTLCHYIISNPFRSAKLEFGVIFV